MSKYIDGIHEEHMDNFLIDLRSGEYEQGSGTLERAGKFCCLGVACIRPAAEGVVSRHEAEEDYVEYDYNSAEMPKSVADYLGIPKENRTGHNYTNVLFYKSGYDPNKIDSMNMTAIGLNDTYRESFATIADAFEREFTRERQ